MRLVAVIALASLLASGCTAPEADQVSGFRVDGTLIDQMMNPYGNETVWLVELERATTTTPYGGFSFLDVPPGTYTFVAAPHGGATVEERIEVNEDTPPVFLQAPREQGMAAYLATLSRTGHVMVGLPGEECLPCSWQTRLAGPVEGLVLRAEWDDPTGATLRVRVHDALGRTIRDVEGSAGIWEPVAAHELEGVRTLFVQVFLGDDAPPRLDLEVSTFLDVHYADTRPGK